jgi:Holliday junction resolvasome RuvABC ATP-dependent DNA helicase subunit
MNDTVFETLGLFKDVIGQEKAKKVLMFYLSSYLKTRIVPHILLAAPKGQGKTKMGKELGKGLIKFDELGKPEINPETKKPRRKSFLEINCSGIKNVKQFINSLIIPHAQDKDVTFFFDEASELPKDVEMAMLTILNPNPENKTSFSLEEYTCDFDFRKHTFIFATSEVQQVNHALIDRLTRIDLEDYTFDQMAKIVQKGAPEVNFQPPALKEMATVLRGNARAAQKMADNVRIFLKGRTAFTSKDWKAMKETLSILPLGLSAMELQILNYLRATSSGISLTCLAARTGLSRESLQKDYELYLQKHGLMEITTGGRELTAKGLQYLKDLDGRCK